MKIRWKTILIGAALLLLLSQAVLAMTSPAYRLDWNNLASGSGGPAQSTQYKVNFTVGQTASGVSSSPLYRVQMGYWGGIAPEFRTLLAIIKR